MQLLLFGERTQRHLWDPDPPPVEAPVRPKKLTLRRAELLLLACAIENKNKKALQRWRRENMKRERNKACPRCGCTPVNPCRIRTGGEGDYMLGWCAPFQTFDFGVGMCSACHSETVTDDEVHPHDKHVRVDRNILQENLPPRKKWGTR